MNNNSQEHTRYQVKLQSIHQATGKTKHTVNGIVVDPPCELRIVQLEGDHGFYLIHFNEKQQEITDTLHSTCLEAMKQAEFEFGIMKEDWEKVP